MHARFTAMKPARCRIAADARRHRACLAYLVWKIDLGQTLRDDRGREPLLHRARARDLLATTCRWPGAGSCCSQREGIHDSSVADGAYFVSYAAGQVLPTSVGGDAVRIYETAERHPGQGGPVAGSILLERVLGGAATLILAGIGLLLAYGNYDIGIYLWVEVAFVVLTLLAGIVLFSKRVRPLLRHFVPILKRPGSNGTCARSTRGSTRIGTTQSSSSS